jgi:Nitrile hydratase, alpha chain.
MGSHHSEPEPWVVHRVRALESLLIEKGLLSTEVVDKVVQTYEKDVGPMNGAKVVAHAWVDPAYRQRLLADGTAAIAELGIGGRGGGDKMVVVENTPSVHNMVVCTLCSCYPWPVLGLPPVWYKSPAYRSRAVLEPRKVLAEFGVTLPETPRSACGTRARRSATWCSRGAPTGRSISPKPSWPLWSPGDAMIGVAQVPAPAPAR